MLRSNPDAERWLVLQALLDEAKAGIFDGMHRLIELYASAETAVFQFDCSRLLGDAGTSKCIQQMLHELHEEDGSNPGKVFHYCSALQTIGDLSTLPAILSQYLRLIGKNVKSAILPIGLSSMLEDQWGPISRGVTSSDAESYRVLVMERYSELTAQFGSENVYVFNGDVWSVVGFAKLLLDRISDSKNDHTPKYDFRRRFEASTGVNCARFYVNKRFQPLAAAAIVEQFLESGAADKYEPGVRYFFGHRIPD